MESPQKNTSQEKKFKTTKTFHSRKKSKTTRLSKQKEEKFGSYTLGHKESKRGSSLATKSLGLSAFTARAGVQVLVRIKILQAAKHRQKKKASEKASKQSKRMLFAKQTDRISSI